MKITFKSENGHCPSWTHDGINYFIYEDYDGTWTLKSKRLGFVKKDRFYGSGIHKIHPSSLLNRYFKKKTGVKYERKGHYEFYYWNGKQYATDGNIITVTHQVACERPYFSSYFECLKDAKEYLADKYADGQLKRELN